MQAQITKAVLSQALLFGIKDALEACAWPSPSPHTVSPQPIADLRPTRFCVSADVVLVLIYYSRKSGKAVGVKL